MYKLIKVIEKLNESEIVHNLWNVKEVMNKASEGSWECEIDEEISVLWRDRHLYLSFMDEGEEDQLLILPHPDLGVWYTPEYEIGEQFLTSEQEMLVKHKADQLRSDDYFVDDEGYWVIECGDEGFMEFDAELGYYIIGRYGNRYPFTALNNLCNLPQPTNHTH